MPKTKTVTTSVRLPKEVVELARKMAAADDRSFNSFIVHALRQHVQKLKGR